MTATLDAPAEVTQDPVWLDDVIKRVRDFDASRPRSQQVSVGWSEVGGCRAAIGFRLDGTWPSDETDSWGAQRGTAIHEYLQGILGDPGVRIEVDTIYRGIPGHADIVEPDAVTDIKTTKLANSKLWAEDHSLLRPKRIQAQGYAAGLVDAGELPEDAKVRLLVVPVDGTFADWWVWEEPFDRALADEGADRLEEVRGLLAAGEHLPKDKPYTYCETWCEFFSLCRSPGEATGEVITDPETVAAVAKYAEARDRESAAKKEKERLASLVRGLNGVAGNWRVSMGQPGEDKEVLDEFRIRSEYEASGRPLPVTTKPGSSPRLSVTRVKSAAKS